MAQGQPHAQAPAVTLPAPAVWGFWTQESDPGLSAVGRRVGGLSPGLGGGGGLGEGAAARVRNRGDMERGTAVTWDEEPQ